jgi:LysR family hydrogen peroxide-inducible transcriptional activator
MTLRDLQYALALEEHGHFSRAAEACDVSQPTLSGQIHKLEDELGVQLFERAGRRVRVTAAGAAVLAHARQAVGAVDDLVRTAEAGRDPMRGALRLGIITTLAPYLLPSLLPAAQRRFPDMPLAISEEQTVRLIARIHAGELDAAILATDHPAEDLATIELFDEPLWLALPANHALARHAYIDAEQIDPAELLLLTDGHCLRDQALDLCSRSQDSRRGKSDLRATSLETLRNLVEAGYGVTVLPELALGNASSANGRVVTRPFRDTAVHRRIRLVYRPHSPRRTALNALAAVLCAALPEISTVTNENGASRIGRVGSS